MTSDDYEQMRRLYCETATPRHEISRRFKMSVSHFGRIVRDQGWPRRWPNNAASQRLAWQRRKGLA